MVKLKTLSPSYPILLAIIGTIIFAGVYYNSNRLPKALTTSDEALNPNRFIAERARKTDYDLSNLGVKVAGSYNNQVLAKQYLVDEIERIRNVTKATQKIEVDIQRASGSFAFIGMTSVYTDIENVVVRLSPALVQPKYSLLINSHFDSVPVSPGASDASYMVSVMLEVLRVLATSSATNEHSIVFLFNGAEENGLQGSHPFITQHKWAADVRAYINLDAAGSGGKDSLFQLTSGAGWLMRYYQKVVPHPTASGMSQELFQMNLIPSDTDFRIFRDYGRIAGVDIAMSSNGYVYHTRYDRPEIIPIESYQNTGDNLLAFAKVLANAPELNNLQASATEDVVFFDFLGFFVVNYTKTQGMALNIAVSVVIGLLILASLEAYAKSSGFSFFRILGDFILILIAQVLSVALGGLFVLGSAAKYDQYHHSMAWYSNPWLAIGMYMFPMFLALGLGPAVYMTISKWRSSRKERTPSNDGETVVKTAPKLTRSFQVQMFLHAQAVILIAIMLGVQYMGFRSAYMVLIGLVFYGGSLLVNWTTSLQTDNIRWIHVHLIGNLPAFLFYSAQFLGMVPGLMPVEGRTGITANPENTIAIFTLGAALLLGGFFLPVLMFVKRPLWLASLIGLLWLATAGLVFSPIGFPYRADVSFERFWIYHTDRTFHSFNDISTPVKDSGYFMLGMDRHNNEYITGIVPNMTTAVSTATFCDNYLFCGTPLYTSRQIPQASTSVWVPASSPNTASKTQLKLVSSSLAAPSLKRYNFELTGPDHIDLFISPFVGSQLVNWTFSSTIYPYPALWHNRSQHFVFLCSGALTPPKYQFSLDVQTSLNFDQPSIEIGAVGQFTHYDEDQTVNFKTFLAAFPRWAHVTPWMSSYESWVY